MARKRRSSDSVEEMDEQPVFRGRQWRPKKQAQSRCWDVISNHSVVFILGPAGTAKTYTATSWAMNAVDNGDFSRLVLTRPVVEATESLGYLPGDISQKLQPYMRPVTDTIAKVKVKETPVEIIPLAFMRGLTLDYCVGILDEAQNCSETQLKLYLTRLGENAKMIICGDTDQSDVRDSGLWQVSQKLLGLDDVAVFEFTSADIVRHPLVGKMLSRLN